MNETWHGYSLRPRHGLHELDLHPASEGRGPTAFDGQDRIVLRQQHDRFVLGQNANRAAQSKKWRARLELANAIFDYLEAFHNRKRRHSMLGMRSPIEYEKLYEHNQQLLLEI